MKRLTILALLSTTVAVSIGEMEKNEIVLTELNRFVGSDGQPINLAEEPGKHLRIELTQKKKYHKPRPADKTVLMYA